MHTSIPLAMLELIESILAERCTRTAGVIGRFTHSDRI